MPWHAAPYKAEPLPLVDVTLGGCSLARSGRNTLALGMIQLCGTRCNLNFVLDKLGTPWLSRNQKPDRTSLL